MERPGRRRFQKSFSRSVFVAAVVLLVASAMAVAAFLFVMVVAAVPAEEMLERNLGERTVEVFVDGLVDVSHEGGIEIDLSLEKAVDCRFSEIAADEDSGLLLGKKGEHVFVSLPGARDDFVLEDLAVFNLEVVDRLCLAEVLGDLSFFFRYRYDHVLSPFRCSFSIRDGYPDCNRFA